MDTMQTSGTSINKSVSLAPLRVLFDIVFSRKYFLLLNNAAVMDDRRINILQLFKIVKCFGVDINLLF